MKFENQHILIISNEPWSGTWFSKHHYAVELSKKNKVYFIDPPSPWRPLHLFSKTINTLEVNSSLQVISYVNTFPFTLRSGLFQRINSNAIYKILNTFFLKKKIEQPVFWSFDPFRLTEPAKLGASTSLYHCMDHYKTKNESSLAKNVDAVVTVSAVLAEKLRPFNKHTLIVPHGIPGNLSENHPALPADQFLLAGTINYRVDLRLLDLLAEKHPGTTIKIMGKVDAKDFSSSDVADYDLLRNRKNVDIMGPRPFEELGNEIKRSALCLCIYKQDKEGNKLSSLKIMQYLAFGKPVASTYMREYENLAATGLIDMSTNHEQFLKSVEDQLKNHSPELAAKRIHYASGYTYEKLVGRIEEAMNSFKQPAK